LESDALPTSFEFGEFTLDVGAIQLRGARGPIELEARAFDVLLHLIRHRHRVVSKQELLDAIWAEQEVGESTLTRSISLVRRALRESAGQPRYLQTLRGRGYRFTAEVSATGTATPVVADRDVGRRGTWPTGLVGRSGELERVRVDLERAAGGSFRLFWLSGPAGIGKTRLCGAILDHARVLDARIASARCDGGNAGPPFWPWIQILRELLEQLSAGERDHVLEPVADDLVQLVPEWVHCDAARSSARASEPSRTRADAEESRFRLFDSVARLLRALAQAQPLLIFFDDIHTADPPSLLLLEFVARHLEHSRIFVLGSYRSGSVAPEDLFARMRASIGANVAVELELGPLSAPDAAPFLLEHTQQEVPDDVANALWERAGGNPLFLRHLANSLASRAAPSEWKRALEELAAPDTVLDAVRQDLARLSTSCVESLEIAAVTGRQFQLGLCTKVSQADPEWVLHTVREALAARVIEPASPGSDEFRFVHPLIYEALYEGVPIDRRAALHLRVADNLQQLGDAPNRAPRLAYHYWNARLIADAERVREAQLAAAREALQALSFEEAATRAKRALEVAAPWESVDAQVEVFFLIAEACHLRGDDQGMREWCFRASRQARTVARFDLMARAALGFFGVGGIGRLDGAWVSLAEETLSNLDPSAHELRARLLMQLALEYYWAGYTERGLGLSAQAESMARKLADPGAVAGALDLRLSLLRHPDDLASVLERVDEILRILPPQSNPEVEMRVRLVRHDTLLEEGRISEARIEGRRVIRWAEELRLLWPLRVRLLYELMQGRHAEVEAFILDAIRSGRIDFSTSGEWAQNFMVVLYHLRFQQERLPELLPVIGEWAARFPAFPGVRIGLAQAHVQAGELDEARELVADLARNDFEDIPRDQIWLWFMVSLAEVSVVAGSTAERESLRRALWSYRSRVALISSDACLGSVARVVGLLDAANGRPDSAIRALEQALRVDAKLGEFLYARTAVDLSHAYLARGGVALRARARSLAETVVQRIESAPGGEQLALDLAPWLTRARDVISST